MNLRQKLITAAGAAVVLIVVAVVVLLNVLGAVEDRKDDCRQAMEESFHTYPADPILNEDWCIDLLFTDAGLDPEEGREVADEILDSLNEGG